MPNQQSESTSQSEYTSESTSGFAEFVVYCRHSPEFMREYDRLRGSSFTSRGMRALADLTSCKRERDEAELMAFLVQLWERVGRGKQ